MALPTLPADGDNPWGATLRTALTDISSRADDAIERLDVAEGDLDDIDSTLATQASTLSSHGSRLTAVENSNDTKAADNAVVKLTGNQSISGTKTFNTAPNVPNNAFDISKISGLQSALNSKAPLSNPTFTGTVSGISKSMVGLANVNNTADDDKPISTAMQTALNAKASNSDLNQRIAAHNHQGGANGPNISISAVSNLQNQLDGRQGTLARASTGSGAVTWDSSNYTINYFGLRRWGAIVFVTIAFTIKYNIGNNLGSGNFSNKPVVTFKNGTEWSDMWTGASNSTYPSMMYPLSTGPDGLVIAGYLNPSSREIVLAASVPDNISSGYTFSLSGIYLLNSDTY